MPPAQVRRAGSAEFRAQLNAPPLRQGINQVIVLPGKGSIGRTASQVTWMELSVSYRRGDRHGVLPVAGLPYRNG